MSMASDIKFRRRISTLLSLILFSIAGLVLLGLVVMTLRLVEIQSDLAELRDNALPRLAKLSQLSQEAAATISIAPALSAKPTRFEFETLLSRIVDKEISQQALIEELAGLVADENAAGTLRHNGDLLMENLRTLTDVVSAQIEVRKRLESHVESFRRLARSLSARPDGGATADGLQDGTAAEQTELAAQLAHIGVLQILNTLLDPNGARFSRNKAELESRIARLSDVAGEEAEPSATGPGHGRTPASELLRYWSSEQAKIYQDKQAELSNDFKIKALVEENSLIANRLLSSANSEFWRASRELEGQIASVDATAQFTLISIFVVVAAFGAGNFLVWIVLKRRVFQRLDRIRAALLAFADDRNRPVADPVADEIGAISGSLIHYMAVIDQREAELAEKTHAMEQLSAQLAKYLSPQVYDSIFTGRQEVKVASSRKKLTIFFSDIAGFTEAADRLESEELSQLLNHYLTEMSRIALDHGATIDKYVGDAILAFFGDPETNGIKEDALDCVEMAIAMRERMHGLQEIWRDSGIEKPLQVRMGINTGFCTVGNFGSEDRLDYTIIGGAVNTASRLESLAAPGDILISYETFALVRDRIRCEEHGEIEVKGIAYPVATYKVADSYETLRRQERRVREDHPGVTLDLDLDAMTAADRGHAADILRRALEMVTSRDGGASNTPGPRPDKGRKS
jgi:class 3 adenylate cyclase